VNQTQPKIATPASFPCFVAVKVTERTYAGPEEGGTYYDAYEAYEGVTQVYGPDDFHLHASLFIETYRLQASTDPERAPYRWNAREGCRYTLWTGSNRPTNQSNPRPQYE